MTEATDLPAEAGDIVEDVAVVDGAVDDKAVIDQDKGNDTVVEDGVQPEKLTPPDNWRELLAGGDDAALKRLTRFSTPANFFKAFADTQDKLRSSKIKRDMPDPADEKAMAEWRKSEGIPDDPTGYEFPQEIQSRMTDEDKPILASFTEFAHKANLPPAAVQTAAEWYVSMQESVEQDRVARDKTASSNAEEVLRDEWGNGEYKVNLTLGHRYLESIPGLGADFAELRLPDGTLLGSNPDFVKWAADQGRMQFGDVTFASSDAEIRHNSRKAEIEKIRSTDFDRYEREGLAKEMREIIERELKRAK